MLLIILINTLAWSGHVMFQPSNRAFYYWKKLNPNRKNAFISSYESLVWLWTDANSLADYCLKFCYFSYCSNGWGCSTVIVLLPLIRGCILPPMTVFADEYRNDWRLNEHSNDVMFIGWCFKCRLPRHSGVQGRHLWIKKRYVIKIPAGSQYSQIVCWNMPSCLKELMKQFD